MDILSELSQAIITILNNNTHELSSASIFLIFSLLPPNFKYNYNYFSRQLENPNKCIQILSDVFNHFLISSIDKLSGKSLQKFKILKKISKKVNYNLSNEQYELILNTINSTEDENSAISQSLELIKQKSKNLEIYHYKSIGDSKINSKMIFNSSEVFFTEFRISNQNFETKNFFLQKMKSDLVFCHKNHEFFVFETKNSNFDSLLFYEIEEIELQKGFIFCIANNFITVTMLESEYLVMKINDANENTFEIKIDRNCLVGSGKDDFVNIQYVKDHQLSVYKMNQKWFVKNQFPKNCLKLALHSNDSQTTDSQPVFIRKNMKFFFFDEVFEVFCIN